MALFVEDGSIVSGAESFCTVAFADDYHSKRSNAAWADYDNDTKEACLRKGAEFMLQKFRQRWKGFRVDSAQEMDWPRTGVVIDGYDVDFDIVPIDVKRANAELALRAGSADLYEDESQGVISESVGPLSVTYDATSPQAKRYKSVDAMLAPYLTGSSISAKVRV